MIKDVCRELVIWIRFHPAIFAAHFIVVFLIVCSGSGIGWIITLSAVNSSFLLFTFIQMDFLIPLTDGERRKRIIAKVVMMVLYLNLLNLCASILNICVYGRLEGDFAVGAGGIGRDVFVLAFWLILLLLISLQQGVAFIRTQLEINDRRQFGKMLMGEKVQTALRFAPLVMFVIASVVTDEIRRPISPDFLLQNKAVGNFLMMAILFLMLCDVVWQTRKIWK